jgi:hypothetical protein
MSIATPTYVNKIKDEKAEVITNINEIQMIMRE